MYILPKVIQQYFCFNNQIPLGHSIAPDVQRRSDQPTDFLPEK
jgi:hypothetical protein